MKRILSERITIQIPSNLTLQEVLLFKKRLDAFPVVEEFLFDCQSVSHVEPFSMLLAARYVSEFMEARKGSKFFQRGINQFGYPAHMGFFVLANLTNRQGEQKLGNPRYIPISSMNCNIVKQEAHFYGLHPCDILKDNAHELAKVLAQSSSGLTYDFLSFSILEILRNVIEHSEAGTYHYCGQFWPTKDLVEIAILDDGVGLRRSLIKNPSISNIDDRQALNLALTPGVSATVYSGQPKGVWSNAGMGLYMTSRLCGEGGNFTLMSGSRGVTKLINRSEMFECELAGTAVRLRLRPQILMKMKDPFGKYAREAEEIRKVRKDYFGHSPSMMLKKN